MLLEGSIAEEIAASLLQINAIKLNTQNPFTWASGWQSPIYCDNRQTLSFPAIRTKIKQKLAQGIIQNFPGVEVIAGVATAGIPHGALVADEMGLPFVYVRSAPKKHGLTNAIEGKLVGGEKVVVIEDLISTAKSSLAAVDTLRERGAEVMGMAAIFTYNFDTATQNLSAANCPYFTLSDYNTLIGQAIANGTVQAEDQPLLQSWRSDPGAWMQDGQP